jgi:glycosyltransferase involved in cell wall biosynthesis
MINSKINVYVLSAVPTPHNNCLFKELIKQDKFNIKLYYAKESDNIYNWKINYYNELRKHSSIIGKNRIDFKLILEIIKDKEAYPLFVHWPTNTSRLLIIILSCLRRKFCYWTDLEEKKSYGLLTYSIRRFLYYLIKRNADPIFLVGKHAIDSYKKEGYPEEKLTNLPIFIDLPTAENITINKDYDFMMQKYGISNGTIVFSSGSRLVKSKGYDLLIEAINVLMENNKELKTKFFIVGKGEEENELKNIVAKYTLDKYICFIQWLEFNEYENLIRISRAFIHPARFDSFGGGTLVAMANGVPVIGSTGAGAVSERVINNYNGFIYKPDDVETLSNYIYKSYYNLDLMKSMGENARKTALEWNVDRGADIIYNNINKKLEHANKR